MLAPGPNKLFIAGWDEGAQARAMIRQVIIAGIGAALLAGAPALAQEMPELEGAPGPLRIPPPVVKPSPEKAPVAKPKAAAPVASKTTTTASVAAKAEEARLGREAEDLRLERVRLDKQAAELKTRQVLLDARAADLAAKEKGVAAREKELAEDKAQLARDTEDVARQLAHAARAETPAAAPASAPAVARRVEPSERRFGDEGLDREIALDVCIDASRDAARVQNFYSARYDVEPRFYEGRYLQVRGMMRVEDRRGYRILDTLCEVDAEGDVQRFVFLR
mgnify:CR=1 FL=1